MTQDPVSNNPLNVTRTIVENRVTYTIWSDKSDAKISIEHAVNDDGPDDATVSLLSNVIDEQFSKSMLLEFAQADLANEMSADENE